MRRRTAGAAALLATLSALAAPGCSGLFPRAVPASYYVLSPVGGSGAMALPVALGVGPVQLPEFLDRPQIATRTGPNEVGYSETHRWAAPLQQGVLSVLALDLGARLGTDRVSSFPFALGLGRDYDVIVDFARLEASASGEVSLDALWRIRDVASGQELVARRSILTRPAPAADFAAQVGALSDALGELADQIAAAVREVSARR